MGPIRSIEELTRRNVGIIAEMERAASDVRTRGDRIADRVAAWVGSWTFIVAQTSLLLTWMVVNVLAWIYHWDPYPFVLLNLVLSFQSAYAAPVLMISQNRQAKLNERRNHLDLQINMLAEQETTEILRLLHLLCERSGVRIGEIDSGRAFEAETKHSEIIRQIQGEIEERNGEAAAILEEVAENGTESIGGHSPVDRLAAEPGAASQTRRAASTVSSGQSSGA